MLPVTCKAEGLFELIKIPQVVVVTVALPTTLNAPDPDALNVTKQGWALLAGPATAVADVVTLRAPKIHAKSVLLGCVMVTRA
jgi:hypothetical protein